MRVSSAPLLPPAVGVLLLPPRVYRAEQKENWGPRIVDSREGEREAAQLAARARLSFSFAPCLVAHISPRCCLVINVHLVNHCSPSCDSKFARDVCAWIFLALTYLINILRKKILFIYCIQETLRKSGNHRLFYR